MNAPINYTFAGLNPNSSYYLQVEGTYGFANGQANLDATYYIADQAYFPGEANCRGKWQLNGSCQQIPTPFSYQPSHIYKFLLPTGSTQANIYFHDCQIPPNISCAYGDNAGSLTFKIFEQVSCLIPSFDPFPDTLKLCDVSQVLDAGSGFQSYTWNTGATTQSIVASAGGLYKVSVKDVNGCTAQDSTYLSLVNANILNHDTIVCKGSMITLYADSTLTTSKICSLSQIPSNLRNGLVAFYPFCGSSDDISGNNLNGIVNGLTYGTDRFGNPASSGVFSAANQSYIRVPANSLLEPTSYTLSAWINTNTIQSGGLGSGLDQTIAVYSPLNWFKGPAYKLALSVTNNSQIGSVQWSAATSWQDILSPINTVQVNQWILATTSYDNTTGTQKFYLDGQLIGSRNSVLKYEGQVAFIIGATLENINGNITAFFQGKIDDVGFWNRALSDAEINQLHNYNNSQLNTVQWSTGSTANSIKVNPAQTTSYYLTVSDGINSCIDSVKITVPDLSSFNPLQDTLKVCGISQVLDAGGGYQSYNWNTGNTTQSISVQRSGLFKVTVGKDGCEAGDSSYVSLVNANILNNDTIVCKSSIVSLRIDSALVGGNSCNISDIPVDLRPGILAYFPFCGNPNDVGPNSIIGIKRNALDSTDRYGKSTSSYFFNGGLKSVINTTYLATSVINDFSYSTWVNPEGTVFLPVEGTQSNSNQFVIHPTHGSNFGDINTNSGAGLCVGKNGIVVLEHSHLYIRAAIVQPVSLTGWHMITVVYRNKTPELYIDGVFIKNGIPGTRNIHPSLGYDNTSFGDYSRSGFGAGYNGLSNTGSFFDGRIDEIVFWSRSLNASEILKLKGSKSTILWSTGATSNSITVSPTETTTYYVTVSDGITSCTDSVKVTVSTPDTTLQSLDPLQLCASGGSTSRLQAAAGMSAYQWLKDGVPINGAVNRLYTATQTGTYRVIVRNSLGCQDTSRAVLITFYPPPTGQFLTPTITDICEGGFITLNATGAASYQWFRNGVLIPGAITANYNATLPGVYTVNYVSAQGCVAPSGKNITLGLLSKPEATFTYDTYCEGVNSNFISTSTILNSGPVELKWLFADGTIQTGPTVTHNFPRSGAYTVKLVVTPLGCPSNADTSTTTITVQKASTGIRYAPLNAVLNRPVTLNARAIGNSWLWSPATNLNDARSRAPILTPKQEQQYLIRIENAAGCVTTDSLLVRIFDERNIYVAGGFTPNNDGKNDRLYPIPVGIAEFRYLRIYNRWGNLVFETNSTDPSRGWDGTYKGKAQPSDTFTWIAEGVDVDGNIVKRTGNSILIR